jgi:hypothetical protein
MQVPNVTNTNTVLVVTCKKPSIVWWNWSLLILGAIVKLRKVTIKPGTHYPHVTWAHAMLRVQLGYLTLNSGAHSHFCPSAYVTWSDVELWSAYMPACLLNFCWRTHFMRRDIHWAVAPQKNRGNVRPYLPNAFFTTIYISLQSMLIHYC